MKLNSVVHFPFYQMFKLFILDLRGSCLLEAMPLYNTAVATYKHISLTKSPLYHHTVNKATIVL